MERFPIGSVVQLREVLHGRVWASMPVRVIADDEVLAVWLEDGAPFSFPAHPFGPHPWSHQDRWTDTSVLQILRPGDAYAVWAFYRDGLFERWYINFQEPYRRGEMHFDTNDHGLDIVIENGTWLWKDREDVAGQVASGRLSPQEADAVWAVAHQVAAELDRGDWWWLSRWEGWHPDS